MRHIYLLWFFLALLAAACVFALVQVQNVQHHQNDALRSIICRAETFVKADKQATPEQKQKALRFYEQALAGAHLAPCD